MKYTIEPSQKSTVKITMTFDKQEWNDANMKAYQQTKGKYFVNGFRKGKAPKHVIELNYGKGYTYIYCSTTSMPITISTFSTRRRRTIPSSANPSSPSRTSATKAPCSARPRPSSRT